MDWFVWALLLFAGFPVAVIVLGELSRALSRTAFASFCKPLDLFRATVLPLLFVTILLRKVAVFSDEQLIVMVVDTLLWITILNATLAFLNGVLFNAALFSRVAQTPKLLVDLGRLFLVAIGAAIIVSFVWKVDLTGLLAALGVGSVVIGLALQDTLGNVFSGITMLSAGPFQIGSWVRIGDIEGQVRSISMRSMTLALSNGDLVDFPNNSITKEKLRVLGAAHGWSSVSVEIKIDQAYAPERVRQVLEMAATSVPTVLQTPAPSIRVLGLDGTTMIYKITLYVAVFSQRAAAASEFLSFLWYIARRDGIALRGGDATAVAAATPGAVEETLAEQLAQLGTFQVQRATLTQIVRGARIELFRKGEALLNRGEKAKFAFVIRSGLALEQSAGDDSASSWTFGAGDLVVYKALFRGGDAPADVVCASDVEVIRIPIESIVACLTVELALAQSLERLMISRETARGGAAIVDAGSAAGNDRVQILQTMFGLREQPAES